MDLYGDDGIVRPYIKRSWTWTEGEIEIHMARGPRATLDVEYQNLKNQGATGEDGFDSLEYDPGRGYGVIVQRRATPSEGADIYELFSNEMTRPIQSAPYFEDLTAEEIGTVFAVYNSQATLADGSETPLPAELSPAKAQELYKYLMRGQHEYFQSAYVLRRTETVSSRSTAAASYTGVNTVVALPGGAKPLIGSLPAGEWLKKAPIVRQYGSNRWQIVTEYWWASSWSQQLYGGTYNPI